MILLFLVWKSLFWVFFDKCAVFISETRGIMLEFINFITFKVYSDA